MRKLTSVVVAMTLAMGAANIVHAAADNITPSPAGTDKPMMHMPPRHGGMQNDMYKGLNLTDAQKTQMRTIMIDAHKDMKWPSLDDRRAMHSIIASDSFDQAKAEAQATKMSEDGKVRALEMMAMQNKLYNVLTAEQKKQFNQNFEKRLTEKPRPEGKMLPPDVQG